MASCVHAQRQACLGVAQAMLFMPFLVQSTPGCAAYNPPSQCHPFSTQTPDRAVPHTVLQPSCRRNSQVDGRCHHLPLLLCLGQRPSSPTWTGTPCQPSEDNPLCSKERTSPVWSLHLWTNTFSPPSLRRAELWTLDCQQLRSVPHVLHVLHGHHLGPKAFSRPAASAK